MLPQPLLDANAPWKQRFRAPSIAWAYLARTNPARGLVSTNQTDTYQLYAWEVPAGALRQLTDRPEGMAFGIISPDGRYVYYLDDRQGNEIGHYVRIPFEGGEPHDITPDLPPYASWGFDISRAGNRIAFLTAQPDGFHLYALDAGADGNLSPPRVLAHFSGLALGPMLSEDGQTAIVMSTERSGKPQFSLVAIDMTSGERIAELWDGPDTSLEAMAVSPVPGDGRVVASTNRTGIETLLVWNPCTGERTDLQFEGLSGALRAFDWSPDGERLLLRTFVQAVQQLYVYHFPTGRLTAMQHTGVNLQPFFASNAEAWGMWNDPALPPRVVAYDVETGTQLRTVLAAGDVPPGHPWRSVTFRSSDGQAIQAWLGLPDGQGPFPTILETHGGPESVTSQAFSPGSQAWLDHGFAFLSVNYRGSTTFGREFQAKIWGNPGHWEVEDMVAARDWLVGQGISHPDQIFLTGWSYGGYLTLQALGKRPELWAGGLAGIAIADWRVSYEDSADTLKAYEVAMFGGTPEEKPEAYAAASPITYVENVRAPVLIIQGRNDTRTPARPVEMYAERLRALDKPVEVHWFDAGHAGAQAQAAQAIEHQALMLQFAYRVLGAA